MKKILVLTAGFGEGHNSAARGVRDGLARVIPQAEVELQDLFPETYGLLNTATRKAYLTVINFWPRSWGYVYRWLDRKKDFDERFRKFTRLKRSLGRLLDRFQPDVVVSTFPPYPYLLHQLLGSNRSCRSVVVITDSITVNAIWYHCTADYFLAPNELSAEVVRAGGVPSDKIKIFGFPVSPKFADVTQYRKPVDHSKPQVLYVINAGTRRAPDLVRKLLELEIDLKVTVGRDEKLRRAIEDVVNGRNIEIFGWTDQLPRLLCESHLLIGKAGGATVQETIAAGCPMIINHVVFGQEEGNAQLIVQTNSGAIASSSDDVIHHVRRAFADNGKVWSEWSSNINKLSRPQASLDIAEFLLSI